MDLCAIGARIKAAREKAGMTQEDLAEVLEMSPTHISVIERGVKSPNWDSYSTSRVRDVWYISIDYWLLQRLAADYLIFSHGIENLEHFDGSIELMGWLDDLFGDGAACDRGHASA